MNEREIIDIVYAEKKRQGLSYRDLQKRTGRCVNLCRREGKASEP